VSGDADLTEGNDPRSSHENESFMSYLPNANKTAASFVTAVFYVTVPTGAYFRAVKNPNFNLRKDVIISSDGK